MVKTLLAMLLVVVGAALTAVQADPTRPPGWGATAAPAASSKPSAVAANYLFRQPGFGRD